MMAMKRLRLTKKANSEKRTRMKKNMMKRKKT